MGHKIGKHHARCPIYLHSPHICFTLEQIFCNLTENLTTARNIVIPVLTLICSTQTKGRRTSTASRINIHAKTAQLLAAEYAGWALCARPHCKTPEKLVTQNRSSQLDTETRKEAFSLSLPSPPRPLLTLCHDMGRRRPCLVAYFIS